jgi:putative transposase
LQLSRNTDRDGKEKGEECSRELVNRLLDEGAMAPLFERIKTDRDFLDNPEGLLKELVKGVLERGLRAEPDSHLGYAKGESKPEGISNSRNGTTPKTVSSSIGEVGLAVPRDRQASFEPRLVPKGERRLGGLDEMIISLYAGGMTVRDIQHHLARTLGTELSAETISNVTDAVLDEVYAWQSRPLDEVYPVMWLDAIMVKVRDGSQVTNRSAHIAYAVDVNGARHVLGIWIAQSEGAKFWAGVCSELRNRGLKDVLIVCCDGLTGFPEAVEATWPNATVQTCVVHLIRASMRFVSFKDRRAVAAALREIYTAPTIEGAQAALEAFEESALGQKYPATVAAWRRSWERFIPFLAFGPQLRKMIYTTNAIESLNYQLRKIIKNRGHFPNDLAAVKLLWLAIRDIEDKRWRQRSKAEARRARSAPAMLSSAPPEWTSMLGALVIAFPGRLDHRLAG